MNSSQTPLLNIKIVEVCRKTSLSRTTIYRRLESDPNFPKPRKLGANRIAWLEHEIDLYIINCEVINRLH